MRTVLVVRLQVCVERRLHLLDRLEPCAAAFDAEVLVELGTVQALDDAVGLRTLHLGAAVLDAFELQEQLVGMLVVSPAELPPPRSGRGQANIRQYRLHLDLMGFEGRQDVVVQQLYGGDRKLVGIEPGPGVAAVAVDGRLQVDLAHALQGADEEGVDGDQGTGVRRFDVALAELRVEPLQQADLLVGQGQPAFRRGLLQAQQALVLGQQAVALPDPAHAAGGDLDALQHQLLGNPQRPVAGMFQGVVQDGLLDLGRYPVGMRPSGAGHTVDQTVGAVSLEVATDLVELLSAVAHHLAGPGDVAEVGGQFQQRQFAPCYLLLRGHVALRSGRIDVQRHHPNPASKRHGHTRPRGGGCGRMCQAITVSAQAEHGLDASRRRFFALCTGDALERAIR